MKLFSTGILLFICFCLAYRTQAQTPDSAKGKYDLLVTPRFNSAGHFPFTGALLNKNINFDVNVYFEKRGYGFFIFKSFDLEDTRSYVNYLQPGIFKKLDLSKSIEIGFFVGYIFSQTDGFKDQDSDYYTAFITHWDLGKGFRIEYTGLVFDIEIQEKLANRVLIIMPTGKFRLDAYFWNRLVLENGDHSVSASFAINFPKIKLSKSTVIQNTLSYQGYLTENKPSFARRHGIMFNLAFPITLSN